jgi:hypothetical protein
MKKLKPGPKPKDPKEIKSFRLNLRVNPMSLKIWKEAQKREKFEDLSGWINAKLDIAAKLINSSSRI